MDNLVAVSAGVRPTKYFAVLTFAPVLHCFNPQNIWISNQAVVVGTWYQSQFVSTGNALVDNKLAQERNICQHV